MRNIVCLFIICIYSKPLLHAQLLRIDSAGIEIDSIYTPIDTLPVYASAKNDKPVLYPNIASKAIMTPTGWGGYGNFLFAFLGGAAPQVYRKSGDLVGGIGFGAGNSLKTVSVTGVLNINDVSGVDNFSGSLIVSRSISRGTSISAGGLHLFADSRKTDGTQSYFIAFSHADQKMTPLTEGYSRFTYTVGVGSGRFYSKSKEDITAGKGKYGTAVFASASYEVKKNFNLNIEWTGLNLCFSLACRPFADLPVLNIGVSDLTGYSSDGVRFVFAFAYAYRFDRK